MLNAGTVQSFATLDDSGFKSGMRGLKKQGERFSKDMQHNFDKIGRSLTSMGSKMTAAISVPLLGAGALAVKTAADYETLRKSMDILNGSVEEGARNFERLKEFSARTPFQLNDLAKAQNMLQGFGMEADNAFQSIKMIGDIAAVSGGSIEGIGIAFGQAAAEGKLMTRDIRQLINQGVPAIKLLADTMGVAQSEIFDLASQGEISFDLLNKAFQEATSEGGMFADGMKQQAETIGGVFSTLKDNASLALGELGNTIVEELDLKQVMADLISNIQDGVKWFGKLSSTAKRFTIIGAGVATALGPTILAFGMMAKAMSGIMVVMPKLIAGVKALTAAMIANPYIAVGAAILAIGTYAWTTQSRINKLTESIKNVLDTGFDAQTMQEFQDVIVGIENRLQSMRDTAKTMNVDPETFESYRELQNALDEVIRQRDQLAASQIQVSDPEETKETAKEMNNLAVAVERVKVAVSRSADEIIDPAEEARLRALREEFTQFSNALYVAQTQSHDFSLRLEESAGQTVKVAEEGGQAMMSLTNAIGTMFERAVLHGRDLQSVIAGIAKQLAARSFVTGLGAILTGGASLGGSSFLGAVFGGLFHSGGVVQGSGDKMIRAKGGEMVLTKSQQKALSMGGGQSVSINPGAIGKAVGLELDKRLNKLSPEDIFVLSKRGGFSY